MGYKNRLLPLRGLGSKGIITDLPDVELPPDAFTDGRNIRFADGAVRRSMAFKTARSDLQADKPVFATGLYARADYDRLLIANKDGRVWAYRNGAESEITPPSFTPNETSLPFTACNLSGVNYLNRANRRPWKLTETGTQMQALTNWDGTWRCDSLRAFNGMLFAIGMTEGPTNYPYRVRWSDFAIGADEPPSWDAASTTNNAGFNDLLWLQRPLVDGAQLRNAFVLYTQNQSVLVQPTGNQFVYQFTPLFEDIGVISQNCVVELKDRHIVFGPTDIVQHDGSSYKSLVEGRVKKRIYSRIAISKPEACFVVHDRRNSEIWFCYQTTATSGVQWVGTDLANEAAIWNYSSDTWTFVDLPNVGPPGFVNLANVQTWATANMTWDEFQASWDSLADTFDRSLAFVGAPFGTALVGRKILVADPFGYGARLAYPIEAKHVPKTYVERRGLDLDELGAELRGYKFLRAIYPQLRRVGQGRSTLLAYSTQYPGSGYTWSADEEFTSHAENKVDFKQGGRYLGYKVMLTEYADMEFTGVDLDVVQLGRR